MYLRTFLRTTNCSCLWGVSNYQQMQFRFKYNQNHGVKGIRNRKSFFETNQNSAGAGAENEESSSLDMQTAFALEDRSYDEIAAGAMRIARNQEIAQNVLVIQPYIKWGQQRNKATNPDDQLIEAEALIRSIPNWQIALSLKVPLESLERRTLFGKGKIEELKTLISEIREKESGVSQTALTCLFVSKSMLTFAQRQFLETQFHMLVLDRYSVVIQILRLHATSVEAKLQVAMAELPYIWAQARDANVTQSAKRGYALTDLQREILRTRERKLKLELDKLRSHRKLLRKKRTQNDLPIVAVVGYTNSGKTSLIKALTSEDKMEPRDQLFATLDVTAHGGLLPCNLQVIYMDTVGFMSDLPTGLFECFITTLEDAMLADIIIHVQDIAHPCHESQRSHVEQTLKSLVDNYALDDVNAKLPPIINVCNKIDMISNFDVQRQKRGNSAGHLVSAKHAIGLQELLLDVESQILSETGRRKITMRVRNGGPEMSWLHKHAAVVSMRADAENAERLLMNVVITERTLQQFKKEFCQ